MVSGKAIKVGVLKPDEWQEADRIFRLAFGTFLGLPDPARFCGDRQMVIPRCKSSHVKALAARDGERLIGSNLLTRWGSFGFFGPLTVLPEYWDRGVAQQLLQATMNTFDRWGVRRTGLFTFPHSAKHVGLYQKFGYWPQYLTALMVFKPEPKPNGAPRLLSARPKKDRESAIAACVAVAQRVSRDLDLGDEIRSVLKHGLGDVVVIESGSRIEGFAICMHGPQSEGGAEICYVKFAAVRGGAGAADRFNALLENCEAFAADHGAKVEAGVNLARPGAFLALGSRGYKVMRQGIAMQSPHAEGHNRADCWVIDDWR